MVYSVALRMRGLRTTFLLSVSISIFTGCASIGPPEAPSLELPKPPTDLRAARKGNTVNLTWSIPARTTERQSVRYLGDTKICRTLFPLDKECKTMVGSVPPPADFLKRKKPSAKKDGETYVDHLETSIEEQNPTKFAYYSVQVLNSAGKSAGTSNQVKVPLIPTLPPFQGFAAKAEAAGVRISWECPHSVRPAGGIRYSFRIYRRLEAKPGEVVSGENKPGESKSSEIEIAEIPANDCAEAGINAEKSAVSSFLDQTFEWEQTYRYRGTVLSALETPGDPPLKSRGTILRRGDFCS